LAVTLARGRVARMADPSPKRLSTPRVLALSTLAFPLSGIGLPLGVYLSPFYADEIGLGVALTGALFMALRLLDMLLDPTIGHFVDRYTSKWGRARPWIVASVPMLMLAAYFVYMPPREGASAVYFVIWMVILYLGSTMLMIARNAWVADIATDYDDRSRHFVMIEMAGVLSMLFLLIIPVIIASNGGDRFEQISAMGWCLIISLPITALIACALVPDPPRLKVAEAKGYSFADLRAAVGNRYLKTVLLLELLIGMGITVTASLYLFVAESVFGLDDAQASLLLVVFFLSSVLGLPVWMRLAARTEKHRAVCVAVLMSAGSYALYFLAAQVGGFWMFAAAAVINGFAFTAPLVIGRSMTADVVEWELVRSGINRAGLYFGLNAGAYKIGASLATGAAYLLVGLVAGYEAGADNSPAAVQGLLIIFCVLPAALYLITYFAVRDYPLTRAVQAETAGQLSGPLAGMQADDPLDVMPT
jgi:glycoside/pentoside/hexuronide:cation symporter, GPH family